MSNAEEDNNFKPDYDFLSDIYHKVNFYDIIRELQGTGRQQVYDSDILYCMVKAAKAHTNQTLQELKEKVGKRFQDTMDLRDEQDDHVEWDVLSARAHVFKIVLQLIDDVINEMK